MRSVLNAFGGGYYGLTGAEGVPTEWLRGSPFADYFVPSLILLVVVGGSFIMAAIAVLAGLRTARLAALAAGLVVLGWLIVQIAIVGYVLHVKRSTLGEQASLARLGEMFSSAVNTSWVNDLEPRRES